MSIKTKNHISFFVSGLYIFLVYFMYGCVGTVSEVGDNVNRSVDTNPYGVRFDGVVSAKATAHNKARVFFRPAQGGSGIFSYNAYVDGNFSQPCGATSSSMVDDNGMIYIDIKNLSAVGGEYRFSVRSYDVENDIEDRNNVSVMVKLLDYEVPLFDGAYAISNLAGIAGETQLKAKWIKAKSSSGSSGFGSNEHDISGYNIYVGTSMQKLDLHGTVESADATEYIITGLEVGRKYYILVRARDSATPKNNEDLNLEIRSASTLPNRPIVFLGIKTAEIPTNSDGFTKVNVAWDEGSGGFDRYLVYAKDSPSPVVPTNDVAFLSSVVTDLSQTGVTITGLQKKTQYYISVIACNSAACDQYQGGNVNISVVTNPPVAPFSGIKTLIQNSGILGLTQLVASWDIPNLTMGVASHVKLFMTDSSGSVIQELLPCVGGSDICYVGSFGDVATTNGAVIKNLSTASEYCFMAHLYSGTDIDLGFVYKCAKPQYTMPNFGGPDDACSAATASSFKVAWTPPTSPVGTFSSYQIVFKELGGDGGDFSYSNAFSNETEKNKYYTESFNGGIINIDSSKREYVIDDLMPNTSYEVGVKTFLLDTAPVVDVVYRDENVKTIICTTKEPQAVHNGWHHILALGPKVDGRTNQKILETYRDIDKYNADPNEIILVHYPKENKAGERGVNASDSGIVVLEWDDFFIDGMGYLYDKRSVEGTGYNIYRMAYNDQLHKNNPPDVSDLSNLSGLGWGSPVNSNLVKPEEIEIRDISTTSADIMTTKKIGRFIDYTVSAEAEVTKTYWYLVVAVVGNKAVPWATVPVDARVEVPVPPNNMALVHRWMANKNICKSLFKTPIREKNYKCLYNGLSAVIDQTDLKPYYDMEKHLLVDRFHLGVNFTKGESACSDDGYTSNAVTNAGSWDGLKGGGFGDCIGSRGSPNGLIVSKKGSVFYDRYTLNAFINTSGVAWDVDLGKSWSTFLGVDNSSTLTKTSSVYYSTKINDVRLGKIVTTNNSHMPVLTRISQQQGQVLCHSHEIIHNGLSYEKRLMRRKEHMALSQVEHSIPLGTSYGEGRLAVGSNATYYPSLSKNRGCISTKDKINSYKNLDVATDYITGSDLYPIYGGYYLNASNSLVKEKPSSDGAPLLASGSSGDLSTEMCVSRYGIQDAPAFLTSVLLADHFWCSRKSSKSICGCDVKYEWSSNDVETRTERSFASGRYVLDPGVVDTWKNGSGMYFNNITASGNNMALPYFSASGSETNTVSSSIAGTIYRGNYYSPVMNIGLVCNGSSCLANEQDNDDKKISRHDISVQYKLYGYYQGSTIFQSNCSSDSGGEGIVTATAYSGWDWSSSVNYGTLYVNTSSPNGNASIVRCLTAIPSYGE